MSVIVFGNKCKFKSMEISNGNYGIVKLQQVFDYINEMLSCAETKLSDIEIDKLYNELYPFSQVDENIKIQHIVNIKNNISIHNKTKIGKFNHNETAEKSDITDTETKDNNNQENCIDTTT